MRFTSSILGLAITTLLTAASAKADPVLVNGNFENTTLSNSSQVGNYYGGQAVTGWNASGYTFVFMPGQADTIGAPTQFGPNLMLWGPGNGADNGLTSSPDGGNYIGMDGAFENGSVSQTISGLSIGDLYTISFWFAGAQQNGFDGNTTEGFDVQFGNDVQSTPQLQNVNHGFTGWQQESLNFVAQNSTQTLTFLAQGTPSGEPPFSLLDGVNIAQTPEPNSLALLGTGLVGLAGAARRRFGRQA